MKRSPDEYPTSAFDYELPPGQIARYPAEQRDRSRLLVLRKSSGAIEHRVFHELIDLIPPGDALVLNETRVFPARLLGRRESGAEAEVLLLRPTATVTEWEALVRPGAKLKPGKFVTVADDFRVEMLGAADDHGGARNVRLHTSLPVSEAIALYGRVPLPPYIERAAEPADLERYQTVYAAREGSVAAPTAGLHFTRALLDELTARDVALVRVTLHVGVGTFRPVETEDPSEHPMHEEQFDVSEESAAQLNAVRARGGKIWAVGTTVTRTLETVCDDAGVFRARRGATRLFIRPPYSFKGIDRLITNFHLPRSTLLMLVAAFAGYDHVMTAYRTASDEGYRFYSYGDAMAIV